MDKKHLKRTVIKNELYSRHLKENRSVRIYLPPGYNELLSYPIVYAQDGQDMFMYGRIATIANYLILEKNMEPIIIVGVDVDKKHRTSEYSPIGEKNQAYKQFFVDELIPFIENDYPVRKSGIDRLLIGDSLGATVSLHLALDYPHLFKYMISLSGAFLTPTIDRIEHNNDLSWLNLWMLIGTEEHTVDTHMGTFDFLQWNRTTKQILEQKKVELTYSEREGKHIWGFWQAHLGDALEHFFTSPY